MSKSAQQVGGRIVNPTLIGSVTAADATLEDATLTDPEITGAEVSGSEIDDSVITDCRIGIGPSAAINTAGAVTLTNAILAATPVILADPNGGNRTYTLGSTASLVAGVLGDSATFEFVILNTADEAESITLAAGDGDTTLLSTTASGGGTLAQGLGARVTLVRNGTKVIGLVSKFLAIT